MTIADDLNELVETKEAIRQAIISKGVDVPEGERLKTYPSYIEQIEGSGGGGGGGPTGDGTLTDLKKALNAGNPEDYYPIGYEFTNGWDSMYNPLIVGTYQTINGKKAVGLLRMLVQPMSQQFNATNSNGNYQNSVIRNFLNGEYFEKCDDELKSLISTVSVKWHNGSTLVDVSGKWHLFSGIEVMGEINSGEGQGWEYWQQQTGLSFKNDAANSGRSIFGLKDKSVGWWLRSAYFSVMGDGAFYVTTGGAVSKWGNTASDSYGVLPHCYILAD